MSERRIAVFIDFANTFRNVILDVQRFRQFIEEQVGPFRTAIVYAVDFTSLQRETNQTRTGARGEPQAITMGQSKKTKKKPQGFWTKLRREGFTPRLRPVKVIKRTEGGHYHKANWDVGITIDVLSAAQSGRFDDIVLFAGDSDFEDLILHIQAPPYFMRVTVISSLHHTAWELRRAADRFIDLDAFSSDFTSSRKSSQAVETNGEAETKDTEPIVVLPGEVNDLIDGALGAGKETDPTTNPSSDALDPSND